MRASGVTGRGEPRTGRQGDQQKEGWAVASPGAGARSPAPAVPTPPHAEPARDALFKRDEYFARSFAIFGVIVARQ